MYNWWGIDFHISQEIDRQLSMRQPRRGESKGAEWGGILILAIMVLIVLFFAECIAVCLPLWQRVFLHPHVIKLHMRRARITTITGLVALLLYVVGGLKGWHDWETEDFPGILLTFGTCLPTIGILTTIVGIFQLMLSRCQPRLVEGNGYGWLNLHCLLTRRQPSHLLTDLQDGAILIGLLYPVAIAPEGHQLEAWLTSLVWIGIILVYNLYCQSKFEDGEAIVFLEEPAIKSMGLGVGALALVGGGWMFVSWDRIFKSQETIERERREEQAIEKRKQRDRIQLAAIKQKCRKKGYSLVKCQQKFPQVAWWLDPNLKSQIELGKVKKQCQEKGFTNTRCQQEFPEAAWWVEKSIE